MVMNMSQNKMPINADYEAVAQMQLFARQVVDGVSGGRHRSPHHGSSVEFKEHRQYVKGDELRSIDWKQFGKSDRLFVKQFDDETNLRATLVVDQSGSMKYQGKRSPWSKHEHAIRLAASLATLLIGQQDSVGLLTFDTRVRHQLEARNNASHLSNLIATLTSSQPAGETSLGSVLKSASQQLRRRGMILLFTDCFDDISSLLAGLRFFRQFGHDVVVFQIWDPDELDFPFYSKTQFRSLESTKEHMVEPSAIRTAYLERVAEFQDQLRDRLLAERIELITTTTSQKCGDTLARFLQNRTSSRGGRGRSSQAAPANSTTTTGWPAH